MSILNESWPQTSFSKWSQNNVLGSCRRQLWPHRSLFRRGVRENQAYIVEFCLDANFGQSFIHRGETWDNVEVSVQPRTRTRACPHDQAFYCPFKKQNSWKWSIVFFSNFLWVCTKRGRKHFEDLINYKNH